MLASINPLGERARNQRWTLTVTAYAVGSVGAGAALGGLLGAAGALLRVAVPLPKASLPAAAVALCVLAAAADLRGAAVPTLRRQVNEDWLHRYRGWVYGLGFGAQLGLGVATIITTPTVYAAFALALLTGHPVSGSAIGAAFGFSRAVPVLAAVGVRTPGELRQAHRWLASAAVRARRYGALGLLVAAACLGLAR